MTAAVSNPKIWKPCGDGVLSGTLPHDGVFKGVRQGWTVMCFRSHSALVLIRWLGENRMAPVAVANLLDFAEEEFLVRTHLERGTSERIDLDTFSPGGKVHDMVVASAN